MKKFTLITITKDDEYNLNSTLKSVMNATKFVKLDFVYLIVNGSRFDLSEDLQKTLKYELGAEYHWIPDEGIYQGMNNGLKLVDEGYFMFLNSGDELYDSESFSKIEHEVARNPNATILQFLISSNGVFKPKKKYDYKALFTGKEMHAHPGLIINRDLLKDVFFDEGYRIASDYKFVLDSLKILRKTSNSFVFVESPITIFQGGGISEVRWRETLNEMNSIRVKISENKLEILKAKFINIKAKLIYFIRMSGK